jgi:mono/diheme cytochrome c family protein
VCDPTYISQSNPFAWDDEATIAAGQQIYGKSCRVCHGGDGAGALEGVPNFTTTQTQNALRVSSGEHLCVVAQGRKAMPGWKETLTGEQIWQVLTYIGTLGK